MTLTRALSVLLVLATINVVAQQRRLKFGKVSMEELQLTECSFYPEAEAFTLAKTGRLYFQYNDDKGWQYKIDVFIRQKILKNTAKDIGNIRISTYNPLKSSNKEEIGEPKAVTYNLVNGSIVENKLNPDQIFTTRISDYRTETSFAMPNIKEGSVIEYKYTLTSDYILNLKTWYFQEEIPVEFTSFIYTIPEYFDYRISQVGNSVLLNIIEERVNERFKYRWTSNKPAIGGRMETGIGEMASLSNRKKIDATNILPVVEEPFMTNKSDLPARIELQLQTSKMPNQAVQNYGTTYDKFNKRIMSWSSFGDQLNKGHFAKEFIDTITEEGLLSKAQSIYYWILKNNSWNEVYGFSSDQSHRSTLNDASGSVAALNLALVSALRQAGINANPITLSTRGNGTLHPVYPNMDQFNYVIVGATIEDKLYLLDITGNLPFGMLPERCLNGNGWLANKNGGRWVNLKIGKSKSQISNEITIDKEMITSTFRINEQGSNSISTLNSIKRSGQEEYVAKFSESFVDSEVVNFELTPSINPHKTVYSFELQTDLSDEDLIYIDPLPYGVLRSNPFIRDERISSIDFPNKISESAITTITIPDGYKLELPEKAIIRLPEKAGSFVYTVSLIGNKLSIISRMNLSKTYFSALEYSGLKKFYEIVSAKNNELIVLKKIE